MKTALKDLFSSKKGLVMLAAITVAIAKACGLDLDPDAVKEVVGLAGAYILGQGIADHGATAAQINATTSAILSPGASPADVAAVKAASK